MFRPDHGWRTFLRSRAQIVYFDAFLSRAHGKLEEQNKVLESSIINIINYCTIFNACYIL